MTPARPASLTSPTRSIDHHVLLVRTENTFTDRATLTEELEQLRVALDHRHYHVGNQRAVVSFDDREPARCDFTLILV